jgi:hypothetical protein
MSASSSWRSRSKMSDTIQYPPDDSALYAFSGAGSFMVWANPAYLYSVTLTNDTEIGKAILYDAVDQAMERKGSVVCGIGGTSSFTPRRRVIFKNGIYIVVTGAHSEIMVEFCPFDKQGDAL